MAEAESEGKEYRFKYRKVKTPWGTISRPYGTIFLKDSKGEWMPFFPLIDSGADFILMPKSTCEILGYQLKDGKKGEIKGISCKITAYLHRIDAKIGEKVLSEAAVLFAEKETPILLGREDVFSAFQILFKQKDSEICFKAEE